MATRIATLEDLQNFKDEILAEIRSNAKPLVENKRWIRNNELQDILGISASSIQNLRNNGTIPYTKLSGVIYYDVEQINELLSSGLSSKLNQ